MIKLAGCILLDKENRIALLHRNKKDITQWELPGGKVEQHEDEEAAAIRELQEELGVTVAIQKRVGATSFTNGEIQYGYTWFLAAISKGTPEVQEHDTFDNFQYFSIDELEELDLSANMQLLLEQLKSNQTFITL